MVTWPHYTHTSTTLSHPRVSSTDALIQSAFPTLPHLRLASSRSEEQARLRASPRRQRLAAALWRNWPSQWPRFRDFEGGGSLGQDTNRHTCYHQDEHFNCAWSSFECEQVFGEEEGGVIDNISVGLHDLIVLLQTRRQFIFIRAPNRVRSTCIPHVGVKSIKSSRSQVFFVTGST